MKDATRYIVGVILLAVAAWLATLGSLAGVPSAIATAADADQTSGATDADLRALADIYAAAATTLRAETRPANTVALRTWIADRVSKVKGLAAGTPALSLAVGNAVAGVLEPWGETGDAPALELTTERAATLAELMEAVADAIRTAI